MRCFAFLTIAVSAASAAVIKPTVPRRSSTDAAAEGSSSTPQTNAARFAAGLPPLPPNKRQPSHTEQALRPRASLLRRDLTRQELLALGVTGHPTGQIGYIRIDRADTGRSIGYLSRNLDSENGWFVPTTVPMERLVVSLPRSYATGSGRTTSIALENVSKTSPGCATCGYLALTQNEEHGDLGKGRPAYAWVTAAESSKYFTGPQYLDNSRAQGGTGYAAEVDVWSVESDGTIMASWQNAEGGEGVPVIGTYNRFLGKELGFTGDFDAYRLFGDRGSSRPGVNSGAVPVTYTFVPSNADD